VPTLDREDMEARNALEYLRLLGSLHGPADWVTYWNSVRGAQDTNLPAWVNNLVGRQDFAPWQTYYGNPANNSVNPYVGNPGNGGGGYAPQPYPGIGGGGNLDGPRGPYDRIADNLPLPNIPPGGRVLPSTPVTQPPSYSIPPMVEPPMPLPQPLPQPQPVVQPPVYSAPPIAEPPMAPPVFQPSYPLQPPYQLDPWDPYTSPLLPDGMTPNLDYGTWDPSDPLLPDGITPNPYYSTRASQPRRSTGYAYSAQGAPSAASYTIQPIGEINPVTPQYGVNPIGPVNPIPDFEFHPLPGYSPELGPGWAGSLPGAQPAPGTGNVPVGPYVPPAAGGNYQIQPYPYPGTGGRPVGGSNGRGLRDRTSDIPSWVNSITQVSPWQVRPQQWNNMLPSEKEGLAGLIDQGGLWAPDWEEQMKRAWPTGNVSGRSWWK
jgi:hypothetical protein